MNWNFPYWRNQLGVPNWSSMKWMLLLGSGTLALSLIVLGNLGVVPLDSTNFFFFLFVTFLGALYRPGWAFLFLVAVLPLETVNLAPEALGFQLRPYQWVTLILTLALGTRSLLKKLPFTFFLLRWFDALVLLLPLGAVIASVNAPDTIAAFKQAAIVGSFFLLYLLVRQYLQNEEDLRQTLPFFFLSSLIVLGYALWQSLRSLEEKESFTAMAERPNGTFAEADWLGFFVLFLLLVLWTVALRAFQKREQTFSLRSLIRKFLREPSAYLFFSFHTFACVILLVAVSRSAWLGALGAALTLGALLLWLPRRVSFSTRRRRFLTWSGTVFVSFLLALFLVWDFHLTSFGLVDRAYSTTGLEEITVACQRSVELPKQETLDALENFGCRHIRLEEKELLAKQGQHITTVYRPDPNVIIRKHTYGRVWEEIRRYPVWGIGWGSIGNVLGPDTRGANLNASNAYLEIWLGSGLGPLVAFLCLWSSFLILPLWFLWRGQGYEVPLFLVTASVGLGIFNLFNSGVLLGFFFVFLAVAVSLLTLKQKPV